MRLKYLYLAMGAVLLGLGVAGASGEWPRLGMTLVFLGLGSGWKGIAAWRGGQDVRRLKELEGLEEEKAALLQESYEKALQDYRTLDAARKSLQDAALSQQIGKLQQISGNLLHYLERNPQKLPLAQRFIDYYQDRAVLLVGKYREFEATNLETAEMQSMKERLRTALDGLDEAYEEQFQRLLSDQFLDLDAELKVMERTMSAEGIQRRPDGAQAAGEETAGSAPQRRNPQYPYGRFQRAPRRALSIIPPDQVEDVRKVRVVQSLCGIFLGGLGVHKFYQRKFFQGVLYVLFSWTLLPGVIGFCEGMRYLFMRLDDFYEEYYLKRQS